MSDINTTEKDSRSIAEQQAAAQAQQQAQQAAQQAQGDAQGVEQALAQQYGLPMPGTRAIASVPGRGDIPGVVESIDEDPDEGGYSLRFIPDKSAQESGDLPPRMDLSPNNGRTIRPEPAGTGAIDNPLVAQHAADVDAAVQQNTHPNPSVPKNTAQENNERQPWRMKEGLVAQYFFQILLIALLGSCAYSYWYDIFGGDRPESVSMGQAVDAQKATEARRQIIKNSVVEMAAKVNAVTNWASNLADGRDRQSSILTAELQKEWVINRPILLLGNIQDIAINSDATYQVVVAHDPLSTRNTIFFPDIRMSLRCPESVAVPLIQAAKKKSVSLMGAITAVTAVIESIVTTRETNTKGEANTVMTGMGKCLDAMYLTERISWP